MPTLTVRTAMGAKQFEYRLAEDGSGLARVSANCQICKLVFVLDGPEESFKRWAAGGYIQDELAHLSKEERELLISRMCEDCWAKTFSNCE